MKTGKKTEKAPPLRPWEWMVILTIPGLLVVTVLAYWLGGSS